MNFSLKKIISVILLICFVGQTSLGYAIDNLAAPMASDPGIAPGHSSTQSDVAKKAMPGAIGNGAPLVALLSGEVPPQIPVTGLRAVQARRYIHEAIDVALRVIGETKNRVPSKHKPRANKTRNNIVRLRNHLETHDNLHLFNAVVDGTEDYLLGFHLGENESMKIGLSVDLVEVLYEISPVYLAQYIYHECTPEYLKKGSEGVDREDHRVVYREIQTAIFSETAVKNLKHFLRVFIEQKISDSTTQDLDPESSDQQVPVGAGDHTPTDGCAILESGKGLTSAQHSLVNLAISEYFIPMAGPILEGEERKYIKPKEVSPSDYAVLDPDHVLRNQGIIIYQLDWLNRRIKELAAEHGTTFDDTLIIHPGTFHGTEEHLFVDTEELPQIRNLSLEARRALARHERNHILNMAKSEEEVQADFPIRKTILTELKRMKNQSTNLPAVITSMNLPLSPRDTKSLAGAIANGDITADQGQAVAAIVKSDIASKEGITRALVLAKEHKTQPIVAVEWLALQDSNNAPAQKFAEWSKQLAGLYNNEEDVWEFMRQEVQEEIIDVVGAIYHIYLDTGKRITMPSLLELYAGMRMPLSSYVDDFEMIVDTILGVGLRKYEQRKRFPYQARVHMLLDFFEYNDFILTDKIIEVLFREGPDKAYGFAIGQPRDDTGEMEEDIHPYNPEEYGWAINASGEELNAAQHRIVNETIATYFEGNAVPPTLTGAALKELDPDMLLDKAGIKVYSLEGFNQKIREMSFSQGVVFNDIVVVHPGTFKGQEKHIFIDAYEIPRLTTITKRNKIFFINHEKTHVENKFMSEAEVNRKYSSKGVLLALDYQPGYNSDFGLKIHRQSSKKAAAPRHERIQARISMKEYKTSAGAERLKDLIASTSGVPSEKVEEKLRMLFDAAMSVEARNVELVTSAKMPIMIHNGVFKADLSLLSMSLEELNTVLRFGIMFMLAGSKIEARNDVERDAVTLFDMSTYLISSNASKSGKYQNRYKTLDTTFKRLGDLGWDVNFYLRLFKKLKSVNSNKAYQRPFEHYSGQMERAAHDINLFHHPRRVTILKNTLELDQPDNVFSMILKTVMPGDEGKADKVDQIVDGLIKRQFLVPTKKEVSALSRSLKVRAIQLRRTLFKQSNFKFLRAVKKYGTGEIGIVSKFYGANNVVEWLKAGKETPEMTKMIRKFFDSGRASYIHDALVDSERMEGLFGEEVFRDIFDQLPTIDDRFLFIYQLRNLLIEKSGAKAQGNMGQKSITVYPIFETPGFKQDLTFRDFNENPALYDDLLSIFKTVTHIEPKDFTLRNPIYRKLFLSLGLRTETIDQIKEKLTSAIIDKYGLQLSIGIRKTKPDTSKSSAMVQNLLEYRKELAHLLIKHKDRNDLSHIEREAILNIGLFVQVSTRKLTEKVIIPLEDLNIEAILRINPDRGADAHALEIASMLTYFKTRDLTLLREIYDRMISVISTQGPKTFSFKYLMSFLKVAKDEMEKQTKSASKKLWADFATHIAGDILRYELVPKAADLSPKATEFFLFLLNRVPYKLRMQIIYTAYPDEKALDKALLSDRNPILRVGLISVMDLEDLAQYIAGKQTGEVHKIVSQAPEVVQRKLKKKMDSLDAAAARITLNRMDYKKHIEGMQLIIRNLDGAMVDNYYALLGVSRYATPEQIKKSYRALAMAYHPDRVASEGASAVDEATEEFKVITKAYNELADKAKRAAYTDRLPNYAYLYPSSSWYEKFEKRLEVKSTLEVDEIWARVTEKTTNMPKITFGQLVEIVTAEIPKDQEVLLEALHEIMRLFKSAATSDKNMEEFYKKRNEALDATVTNSELSKPERALLAKILFEPKLASEEEIKRDEEDVFKGPSEDEIRYMAELFKANLIQKLSSNPEEVFVAAFNSEIGKAQQAQIMPIYNAIDEIRKMTDPATGKPLYPNLKFMRHKSEELAGKIKAETTKLENVFIVTNQDQFESGQLDEFKGISWVAAIDDTKVEKYAYLPVFEMLTLSLMASMNADIQVIEKLYNELANADISRDAILGMIRDKAFQMLPKITAIDPERLRDIYEKVMEIYVAA